MSKATPKRSMGEAQLKMEETQTRVALWIDPSPSPFADQPARPLRPHENGQLAPQDRRVAESTQDVRGVKLFCGGRLVGSKARRKTVDPLTRAHVLDEQRADAGHRCLPRQARRLRVFQAHAVVRKTVSPLPVF